jgi:hypothetical protein
MFIPHTIHLQNMGIKITLQMKSLGSFIKRSLELMTGGHLVIKNGQPRDTGNIQNIHSIWVILNVNIAYVLSMFSLVRNHLPFFSTFHLFCACYTSLLDFRYILIRDRRKKMRVFLALDYIFYIVKQPFCLCMIIVVCVCAWSIFFYLFVAFDPVTTFTTAVILYIPIMDTNHYKTKHPPNHFLQRVNKWW